MSPQPAVRVHGGVLAVVPARDEEATVAHTVKRLLGLPPVDAVVVLADGCSDRTAAEAAGAGASVLVGTRRLGKGRAVESALDRLPPASVYLFVDGDVGETAAEAAALLDPVLEGWADVAVGRFPALAGGGFGIVKRWARWTVRALTGLEAAEPLSGQRAVSSAALQACRPLAAGFGLETAMTIDAARLGYRVVEVPVDMRHRPKGRSVSGFAHRARQGVHILRAVAPRALGMR